MNTSQMMKLKNNKEKENISLIRIKKIKKYNNELLELFKTLLDGKGTISLSNSFNDFVDKAIHHLDMLHDLKEEEEEEEEEEDQNLNKKINNNIIEALNVDYNEIMNEYERRKCLEKEEEEREKEQEKENDKKEEDDEYDEDVEY
jgi:hypothetical protein